MSYARALAVIATEKPEKQSTADFIGERGGIDEIRRSKEADPDAFTPEKLEQLAAAMLSQAAAIAPQFALSGELAPADDSAHAYSLAVVREVSPGKGEIVHGVNNASLLKSVLVHVGKGLKSKAKAATNATSAAPPPTPPDDELEAA